MPSQLVTICTSEATLKLARALKALKKGAVGLMKWKERQDSWSRLFADCTQVADIRFEYVTKMAFSKAVFKVHLVDQSRFAVLKIARSYNIELHRWCAERGLAPPVIAYMNGDGRHLILMEYAESFQIASQSPNSSTISLVSEKLSILHAGGWVHGDCRPNNVLISNDRQTVWFIDFDFSGKEGVSVYPPFLNMTDIRWAEGVSFGQPLHRAHDLHFWQ